MTSTRVNGVLGNHLNPNRHFYSGSLSSPAVLKDWKFEPIPRNIGRRQLISRLGGSPGRCCGHLLARTRCEGLRAVRLLKGQVTFRSALTRYRASTHLSESSWAYCCALTSCSQRRSVERLTHAVTPWRRRFRNRAFNP